MTLGRGPIGAVVELATLAGPVEIRDSLGDVGAGTCALTPAELWVLSLATGGRQIPDASLDAMVRVKQVLGGRVVEARDLDRRRETP